MRIVLDRKRLLGFGSGETDFVVSATAAKVGTKNGIIPSASHDRLIGTVTPPAPATLAYPA